MRLHVFLSFLCVCIVSTPFYLFLMPYFQNKVATHNQIVGTAGVIMMQLKCVLQVISDDHKDDGNGGGEGAIYADEDDEIIEVKEQTM